MKSAFAMFIAVIAMAGLVTAQPEGFDCTTTIGSSSSGANSAAAGGWTYPSGWSEDPAAGAGGDNAFRPWSGGTGSSGTGPSAGLGGGGTYMYCETSGGNSTAGTTFALYCPTVSAGNMDFFYNLNGGNIGTLNVDEETAPGVWTTIFTVSGNMGDVWTNSGPIAVSGAPLRFHYTNGSGFGGDAAIDGVTLPGVTPTAVAIPLSSNTADASIDFDGGAAAQICEGTATTLNASINAANAGAAHDIGYTTTPIDPCVGIPLIDDAINLDLSTTNSLYGGLAPNLQPFGLGFGGSSMSLTLVPAVTAATITTQMGCLDATDPDGISMSGTATLDVAPSNVFTGGALTLGDDDTLEITGVAQGYPACVSNPGWVDVTFYGTVYDAAWVNSNGDVSFTSGHGDFSATSGEWMSQMPRIGFQSDLEPNAFGTVTYNQLADGFRVDYTNVTEWGTGGTGVTSYSIEVSTTAGASITGFTTDGTWGGTSTVMGISNGAAGTHAGVTSFDTLGGAGAGLATDSWIDENTGGMITGAGVNFMNVLFPAADGSSIAVN